eukprot:6768510-Pyramimonas_sp.AAC.1
MCGVTCFTLASHHSLDSACPQPSLLIVLSARWIHTSGGGFTATGGGFAVTGDLTVKSRRP